MGKLEIISFENRTSWDKLVQSFSNFDIYYLSGYLDAFRLHGDGEPILVSYESDFLRGICAYMKRDVANEAWAKCEINEGVVFDITTPYGYGGFIFEGEVSRVNISEFWKAFVAKMQDENIVCAFTRWHPMLQNVNVLRGFSNVIDLGKTIHIDTLNEDLIMQNILSKDRCSIRKATKNGVVIHHCDNWGIFESFIRIYNKTMDKDHADAYYYFEEKFYRSLYENLRGMFTVFYAVYQNKIIAASIILFCNSQVHYHLSGSLIEYRNLNPTNLLLFEVAVWAAQNGYRTFHLGGGVGSGEDPLFRFKKAFNKTSGNQFSISKDIFNKRRYLDLVEVRRNANPQFNEESNFFPLYRS